MSLFKRKSRRSTTVTISDQTRSSKGSLSSVDGKTSSQGSTLSLKVTGSKKIGSVASVKSESRIKHTRFSDNTGHTDVKTLPSAIGDSVGPKDDKYLTADPTQNMAFFNQPNPNLIRDPDVVATGAPMELYASVIRGDKAELKKIITGNPALLNTADNFGRTSLMYCVLADRLDCAKFLINMGCNLDQVDNAGRSATHSAAHKGSYKFLELLHNRGASLDIKDDDGQTPLHLVTRNRTPKCLEYLLRNLGPGMVDVPDNQMRTALHWSAAFNNTECVKLLIKYGINIALTDAECKTPLHWAANNHDPLTVHTMEALLEKSPSVLNWQDNDGRTALHYAVAHGNNTAVEFLVNFKAEEFSEMFECDPDRSDFTHRTPLHWAAQLGHIHVVELLLKGNAKISSSDGNGATPFLYAALTDKHSVVEAMIAHDPKVTEQADIEGRNALMWAAGKGSIEVIRTLLDIRKPTADSGVDLEKTVQSPDNMQIEKKLEFTPMDVNKLDNKGNTALHAAARNGHGALVEILLKNGARHEIANTECHHTPIFGACEKGHVNCVTYLLDYKASVRIIDSDNRTPLHWAALGGHAEVCDLLLQEGLDVDVRDKLERTPLHCAAASGFINCMNLLLENGANVDVQDQAGHSALHWAAQSGHLDAIKLLFQQAVFPNPMEYTEERLTPLDHALEKKNEDVMHYLIEQGALSAEHIRNIAAMRIQAYFRGYKVRRTKEILMRTLALRKEKRKQNEAKENSAATRIQAYYRGYRVRKNIPSSKKPSVPNTTVSQGAAATKIQAYYKGHLVRRNMHGKIFPNSEVVVAAVKSNALDIGKSDNDEEDDQGNDISVKRDQSPIREVDSGSHSPEHEPESSGGTRDEIARDLNIFSNDEGVICDQASTSSSHSTLSCKHPRPQEQTSVTTPYSHDSSPHIKNDSRHGETENDSHALSQSSDFTRNTPNKDSIKPALILESKATNSMKPISSTTPSTNFGKTVTKKTQKRKTKKARSKISSRTDALDSDSSKDHTSSNKANIARAVSSKTYEPLRKSKTKTVSRDLARKFEPSPPIKAREPRTRKKRLILPKKDTCDKMYPGLDDLGDDENIQSENVAGVARYSENDNSYYTDELKLVPKSPPIRMKHRGQLQLSEYIESLMSMSAGERKKLREHQEKRRNAFHVANNAASIIQKAWVRHLRHKNPSLHKQFLTKRKTVKRQVEINESVTPHNSKIEEDSKHGYATRIDHPQKTTCPPVQSKSVLRRYDDGDGVSDMAVHSMQSETIRTSLMSRTDVASNSSLRRSVKAKRPKTSNYGATFISLERLGELSKIYGNPKMMRDLLSNAGRSNTSLPAITSTSPTFKSSEVARPMTAVDCPRQVFEKSLRGTSAYVQPASALHPSRSLAGLPSVTGKSRLSSSGGMRNTDRSKSGRDGSQVDYRLMPLQWQKLYGELQNVNATEAKRRNGTRFSYNVGEIG